MIDRIVRAYKTAAILVLNTIMVLVIVNIGIGIMYAAANALRRDAPGALQYEDARLDQAYPDWPPQERDALLAETWSRPYVCAPFVHYKERTYHGEYVNVDAAGFRWNGREALPFPLLEDAINVFVFGGSTTFGYGVADGETIPAHLQDALRELYPDQTIYVYNFGRGAYYSVLELHLFESLLLDGHIPDIAVFVDGMNEAQSEPNRWREFDCDAELEGIAAQYDEYYEPGFDLPMLRAARSIRFRLEQASKQDDEHTDSADVDELRDINQEREHLAVERWLTVRKMIQSTAAAFDVQALFVWQPDPRYKYDRAYHIFADNLPAQDILRHQLMESRREEWQTWEDFLFLADIQESRTELLYVDAVHYNAAFNAEIAGHIANYLHTNGYILNQ